jgi:putative FmdB family regulatory protein
MTYEFRCNICGFTTENSTFKGVGEALQYPCPQCGGFLRRILSVPAYSEKFGGGPRKVDL